MEEKVKVAKPTQLSEVLHYIQTHPYITQAIAIELFGAYRLSDIIFRLRKRGYDIKTTDVTVKNRYGSYSTFAQYSLEN